MTIDVPLKEVYVAICDRPNAINLPFGDGLYPNIVINWGMMNIGDTHPRPGQTPDTAIETQPKAWWRAHHGDVVVVASAKTVKEGIQVKPPWIIHKTRLLGG